MEENRAKACCGFGHKDVFQNINESLENAVLLAIKNSCEIFYTGAMGDFDNLFSCAVRKAKKTHPNIKLICVKPYMTQDINNNGDFLFSFYDDIIIPPEITGIHYYRTFRHYYFLYYPNIRRCIHSREIRSFTKERCY